MVEGTQTHRRRRSYQKCKYIMAKEQDLSKFVWFPPRIDNDIDETRSRLAGV